MLKLVLLVALSLAVAVAKKAPNFLAVGSGMTMPNAVKDKYHSTDTIINSISDLSQHCKFMTKHEIQATDPQTGAARVNFAYTITDPDTPKEQKQRFMLNFGMHGREYISSETALHMSHFVCQSLTEAGSPTIAMSGAPSSINEALMPKQENLKETAPPSPSMLEQSLLVALGLGKSMDKTRLLNILRSTEIVFIPVLNIDGRKKLESGDTCTNQRKNGRNVDVNRNFADWFNPNNAAPQDEDYQGPHAMSEWETNIVKTVSDQFHPHAFIDVHSGDLGMGYVYGHSGSERTPHDNLNQKWVKAVDSEVFGGQVWSGNLANMGSMPYESHGSSCDYMYRSQGARISGTWEIWRKTSFFTNSASTSSQAAQMNEAASKYDYVSASSTPIQIVNEPLIKVLSQETMPAALQVAINDPSKPVDELQALLQSVMDDAGHSEALGLDRAEMQTLVQSMQAEGKDTKEIQTLLQDMSREQCFAYFNPIMPDHYDTTVKGFTMAILVGAERLSDKDIAVALK